ISWRGGRLLAGDCSPGRYALPTKTESPGFVKPRHFPNYRFFVGSAEGLYFRSQGVQAVMPYEKLGHFLPPDGSLKTRSPHPGEHILALELPRSTRWERLDAKTGRTIMVLLRKRRMLGTNGRCPHRHRHLPVHRHRGLHQAVGETHRDDADGPRSSRRDPPRSHRGARWFRLQDRG